MPQPDEAALHAVVALGRGLRDEGIPTTVDQEMLVCRALAELDVRSRAQFYWAARAAFVHAPRELPAFERVFRRFWAGLEPASVEAAVEHGETDPRMPSPQHGGQSLPQFRLEGQSSQLVDGRPQRASQEIPASGTDRPERESGHRRGVLAAYSPEEVLNEHEPLRYAAGELAAVRRLAEELQDALPERECRRLRPSRRGDRLDLRGTLRGALRTEGEALRLARSARRRRPRRLLILCDVSGSMERYSRALLGVLRAAIGAGVHAETFVFATRLTRLTGPLEGHDVERALAAARAAVDDWSGGTRIGASIAELNRTHLRRGLARGAIVLIVSDGWDRGDPELLARELERLRLGVRRLVWLNPRPADIDGHPLAVGMRAALPHVDDFVRGRDPRAMLELARIISGVGADRPARPQRPLALRHA